MCEDAAELKEMVHLTSLNVCTSTSGKGGLTIAASGVPVNNFDT